MDNAQDVLIAITAKIRDVVRLMSNDATNKDACIMKIDNCLSNLNAVRSIEVSRRVNIQDNLLALRNQVLMEEATTLSNIDEISYNAPRPLTGEICFIMVILVHHYYTIWKL
jgi:hypothetical protein